MKIFFGFCCYIKINFYLCKVNKTQNTKQNTMKTRNETRQNNFGKSFFLGDKFNLYRTFGKNEPIECYINKISDSGLFFKVDKSDKLFSIYTLHSKGATITNGYYLV